MKLVKRSKLMQAAVVLAGALLLTTATPALAQDYPPPPSFSPEQVDNLVSRIALYPDPLLAQIFAAASFQDQIPDAARWADQYRNLRGNELADAIYQSNLQFDPAVQALIPFPSVLDMMASDMNWTSALGNAVLADRLAVMDAVQRMRRSAEQYGYLRSNQQIRVVNTGAGVEIAPVDPTLIYVPVYDPYIVYAPPRPGFFIGGAIGFGSCYSIGAFGDWGWGGGFNWYNHSVFVNHSVWGRTWYNRGAYVHNYGNWDRGAWRNVYDNRRSSYGNYSNAPNRGYQRNAYTNSGGNYRGAQASPAIPNRANQGSAYSNRGSYDRGVQTAPVSPNRAYDQNAYRQNQGRSTYSNPGSSYRGGQSAPAPSNQSYGRSTYSNPGSSYRGGQSAPAPSNQNSGRSAYSNPGGSSRSAPAPAQNRSSGPSGGNGGGRSERNSGRR